MILGAGGFEGNAEMRAEHGVPGEVAWTMAPRATNTGEPINAAIALGAATDCTRWAGSAPVSSRPTAAARSRSASAAG